MQKRLKTRIFRLEKSENSKFRGKNRKIVCPKKSQIAEKGALGWQNAFTSQELLQKQRGYTLYTLTDRNFFDKKVAQCQKIDSFEKY